MKKIKIKTKGDPQLNITIAAYLHQLRTEQQITHTAMIHCLRTSPKRLMRIEQYGGKIGIDTYITICVLINVDPIKLLLLALMNQSDVKLTQVYLKSDKMHKLKQVVESNSLKNNQNIANKAFADILTNMRQDSNKSMREAANELGTCHSFFGKIEKCQRAADIPELVRMSRQFGTDPFKNLELIISEMSCTITQN